MEVISTTYIILTGVILLIPRSSCGVECRSVFLNIIMDCHQYTKVDIKEKDEVEVGNGKSKNYFLRQLLVCSVMWTPYFAAGISLGTPTVYIPQARKEANSTDAVSPEMASWLSSVFGYMSVPWCFILAILTHYIGRKKTFIIVSFNQLIVSTSLYLAVTPTHLLITQILHGLTHASGLTVSIISIAEFVSPQNRGLMMTLKSATLYWAILLANTIGTFAHWRYISVLSFANTIYSMLVWFSPESPTWLATRGRYDECRKAHRWLKGWSVESEEELESLINSHVAERKFERRVSLKTSFDFFLKREFYIPIFLSSVMMMIYNLSGKQVVTLYAIDIVKEITSSESTAYRTMLILDCVSVTAMYSGCAISKVIRRRVLLFTFGSSSVFFLLILSLYLYLVHLSYIAENKYISISLLVGFSISIGLGPIILASSLYGEMIALKYKTQSTVIITCIFVIIQSIILKNGPLMFKYFNMHGMFLFYGTSVSVCLIILYKYLPETKDKSLYEIEKYFKGS